MDPLTPLDTLCRIILRAREYEAQTASDYDPGEDPDNVDDEQEGALSVLEDDINDSVEEELRAAFEDLGEDQLAEVIAFCWVGKGTYDVADWDEAMEEAQSLVNESVEEAIDELMDQPMLASVLEFGPRGIRPQLRRDRRSHLRPEGIDRDLLPRTAEIAIKPRPLIARLRGTKLRSSPCLRARATFGATLFWIVMCGTPSAAVLAADKAVQVVRELACGCRRDRARQRETQRLRQDPSVPRSRLLAACA